MNENDGQGLEAYSHIVEDHLDDFVEELRSIELLDLISFIRFESFPTVEDLVNAATELLFKPDTLTFTWAAGADVRWGALPTVTLGLEFRHPAVSLFFNLTLRDGGRSVDILSITFAEPRSNRRRVLAAALADTRLIARAGPALLPVAAARRARRGPAWS